MASASSRVTVVSPDRMVDLALPGSVPVGDLMPQLLQLCTDQHDRGDAAAWTLRPVGGPEVAWASTLESARVRDGTLLELSPRSVRAVQTRVEDVRDATEDAVDQTVGTWRARDSTTLAALVLAALALVLLGLPRLWTSLSGNGVPLALAVAAGLAWGAIALARLDLFVASHSLLGVGLAWTGALAVAATTAWGVSPATLGPAARAGLCAAAVLSAAAIATWMVPRLAAWSAAAGVVFVAVAGWAAMEVLGRSPDDAVAVFGVLGVLSLGVLPRASLAAGGLARLDYLVRTQGSIEATAVSATFARSRAVLNGALLASATMTAVAAVRLESAGSSAQVALAAALGVCLLLRARAFSQFRHVLTLVLAGAGSLLVQFSSDLIGSDPRGSTYVGLLLVAGGAAVLARGGAIAPNDVAGARSRRLLDVSESLTVATLLPLLTASLGVLDWVRGLVN